MFTSRWLTLTMVTDMDPSDQKDLSRKKKTSSESECCLILDRLLLGALTLFLDESKTCLKASFANGIFAKRVMSNIGVWGHRKNINQCKASLCKTVFLLLFVCSYSKLLSVVF